LPGLLKANDMMPGLHRVRRHLASGVAEYWYAWRGGPCILVAHAKSDALLAREVSALAPAALERFKNVLSPKSDGRFLAGLITSYLSSPEYLTNLAPRTQSDYRRALDVVRNDLGTMEIRALEARLARTVLLKWRDGYADHPKTADSRMAALALVLQWAVDRGELAKNPLTNWPRIYKANRADIIWRPEDLDMVLEEIGTTAGRNAILFAAFTGLRVSDVPLVPWSAVGSDHVQWQTGKSRGRRTVIIPMTDELRALLACIPRRAVTILTNERGRPWTSSGLQTTLQKAKQKVAARYKDGPSPIAKLRFHDLRGTAATTLIRNGATVAEAALILGWSKERVDAIATRYVTGEAIALAIVERMRRNKT